MSRATGPRRDLIVRAGLAVVALTAIVASFDTLARLARHVGWGEYTSWLLPVCIDALALAAGRVWLSTHSTSEARSYARRVSLSALAASVTGNAIGHLVTAEGLAPWTRVLAVAVSAVPPMALAAVGHLDALIATSARAETAPATVPASPGEDAGVLAEVPSSPALETPSAVEDAGVELEVPSTPASPAGLPGEDAGVLAIVSRPRDIVTGTIPLNAETSRTAKRDRGRNFWNGERLAGRIPTGTEVARAAGADPTMGRRWVAAWKLEADAA